MSKANIAYEIRITDWKARPTDPLSNSNLFVFYFFGLELKFIGSDGVTTFSFPGKDRHNQMQGQVFVVKIAKNCPTLDRVCIANKLVSVNGWHLDKMKYCDIYPLLRKAMKKVSISFPVVLQFHRHDYEYAYQHILSLADLDSREQKKQSKKSTDIKQAMLDLLDIDSLNENLLINNIQSELNDLCDSLLKEGWKAYKIIGENSEHDSVPQVSVVWYYNPSERNIYADHPVRKKMRVLIGINTLQLRIAALKLQRMWRHNKQNRHQREQMNNSILSQPPVIDKEIINNKHEVSPEVDHEYRNNFDLDGESSNIGSENKEYLEEFQAADSEYSEDIFDESSVYSLDDHNFIGAEARIRDDWLHRREDVEVNELTKSSLPMLDQPIWTNRPVIEKIIFTNAIKIQAVFRGYCVRSKCRIRWNCHKYFQKYTWKDLNSLEQKLRKLSLKYSEEKRKVAEANAVIQKLKVQLKEEMDKSNGRKIEKLKLLDRVKNKRVTKKCCPKSKSYSVSSSRKPFIEEFECFEDNLESLCKREQEFGKSIKFPPLHRQIRDTNFDEF